MKKIKTTDNTLVGVAVGKEDGVWYVQLTDLGDDSDPSKTTYLSEGIAEGLSSKEEALALANSTLKDMVLNCLNGTINKGDTPWEIKEKIFIKVKRYGISLIT